MSTETNKTLARNYFENVLNARRPDVVDEFVAENVQFHNTHLTPGIESLRQFVTAVTTAFPDGHMAIDFMVAEGDKVVSQLTFSGSHQGEFRHPGASQSIPATGKTVNLSQIYIHRVDNGKIAEIWVGADNMELMQQLGIIPAPQ